MGSWARRVKGIPLVRLSAPRRARGAKPESRGALAHSSKRKRLPFPPSSRVFSTGRAGRTRAPETVWWNHGRKERIQHRDELRYSFAVSGIFGGVTARRSPSAHRLSGTSRGCRWARHLPASAGVGAGCPPEPAPCHLRGGAVRRMAGRCPRCRAGARPREPAASSCRQGPYGRTAVMEPPPPALLLAASASCRVG